MLQIFCSECDSWNSEIIIMEGLKVISLLTIVGCYKEIFKFGMPQTQFNIDLSFTAHSLIFALREINLYIETSVCIFVCVCVRVRVQMFQHQSHYSATLCMQLRGHIDLTP